MKIVSYQCNVCGDIYTNDQAKEGMRTVYFVGKGFELRNYNAECDHHVCNECLKSFKKELDK